MALKANMLYSDPETRVEESAAGLHSMTTIDGRQQTPKPRKLEIQDDELSEAVSMLGFQPFDTVPDLPGAFASMFLAEVKYVIPNFTSITNQAGGYGFTEKWRTKIVDWMYQVVDHYEYSREIVAVSMSMLDRFCMRSTNLSKKSYQL
ncbi:hypothetical protein TrRE_jg2853, partial [Triparma retinervis]